MGLFNKSAEKKYKSASKKIRKINKQLENPFISERKEERLLEQRERAKDDKKVAKLQLTNPPPQNIRKNTTISPKVNINVNSKKK